MSYNKVYHNGTALDALYRGSVKLYPLGYTIKQLIDAGLINATLGGNVLYMSPNAGCPNLSEIIDFKSVMMDAGEVEGYAHTKVNFSPGTYGNQYRNILADNSYTIPFANLMIRDLDVSGDITLNWASGTGSNWTYNDSKPFQNVNCDNLIINYSGNFSSLHNVFYSYKGVAISMSSGASLNSGDLSGCFEFCNNLMDISGVSINWDNVTNIGYAFEWCESLQMIPGNGYTTKPITWAAQAFNYAVNLAEIEPILDVSRLTPGSDNTYKMFNSCSSLRTVRLKGINNADWDFTSGNDIKLDRIDDESIHYICVNATDLDGGTHTVKFPRTKAELHTVLTNDEINALNAKGWTLYATDGEVTVTSTYEYTKITSLSDVDTTSTYAFMLGNKVLDRNTVTDGTAGTGHWFKNTVDKNSEDVLLIKFVSRGDGSYNMDATNQISDDEYSYESGWKYMLLYQMNDSSTFNPSLAGWGIFPTYLEATDNGIVAYGVRTGYRYYLKCNASTGNAFISQEINNNVMYLYKVETID